MLETTPHILHLHVSTGHSGLPGCIGPAAKCKGNRIQTQYLPTHFLHVEETICRPQVKGFANTMAAIGLAELPQVKHLQQNCQASGNGGGTGLGAR